MFYDVGDGNILNMDMEKWTLVLFSTADYYRADSRFAPSQWETRYFVTTSPIGWAQA